MQFGFMVKENARLLAASRATATRDATGGGTSPMRALRQASFGKRSAQEAAPRAASRWGEALNEMGRMPVGGCRLRPQLR